MSKTLAEAIEESKSVDDDLKVKNRKENNSGFKRESEGSSGSSKKFKSESSYSKDEKSLNWCDRCKSKHAGPCTAATLRCNKCGNTGHLFKDCTDVTRCFYCRKHAAVRLEILSGPPRIQNT